MARRFAVSSLFPFSFFVALVLLLSAAVGVAQTTSVLLDSDHASDTSVLGEAVAFTATVTDTTTPTPAGTPTGWVTFKDGTTVIGRALLNASVPPQATFTTALLGAGAHTINAYYDGDATFPANTTPGTLTHTVNKRAATVGITFGTNPVGVGVSSTITATVTDTATTGPPGTPGAFAVGANNLPAARSGHTATLLPDGKVLIAGGKDSGGTALATLVVYDPATETFSPVTGNLNAARSGHTATLLSDGKILFAGGNTSPPGQAGKSAELYTFNSATNTGTTAATTGNMGTARTGHTATLLTGDTVLIAGGESGIGNSTLEVYASGSFTDVSGNLATHRVAHSATLLSATTILFAGGDTSGTFEIYTYSSGTGSTSGTTPWATARSGHSATMLPDGNVLIAGGIDSGTPVSTLEIYDGTGFVAISGALSPARSAHTATLLNNALVLTTGGLNSTPAALINVERYTPSFDPQGTVALHSGAGDDVVTPADPGCDLVLSGSAATTCEGSVTPATVGTNPHVITGAYSGDSVHDSGGSGTGNLEVRLPVTASVTAANKTYDQSTSANITSCSLTGVVSPDVVTCSAASANFSDKNVDTGKTVTADIVLGGADAGNYVLTSTTATTTANIIAADLIITGVTASNKTYNGTTAATLNMVVAALSGVIAGDDVTLVVSGAAGTFSDKNVANGKTITTSGFAVAGADSGNYNLVQPTATANITAKAITGDITASNKVYDGTTAATISGRSLTGAIGGDDVAYSGGTATFSDKTVGNGKTVTATGLTLSGTDAGNYTVNNTATATANITALALTASITVADKPYDGNKSATITGCTLPTAVAGDIVGCDFSTAAATFASKQYGTWTVTATGLKLAAGGLDNGNYSLNGTATTTASITKITLVGSITVSNKVYDGTTTATISGRSLVGVVDPDIVSYTGGTATFGDKNIGIGKLVTATGLTLSGADADNYTVNPTATATANITVATLTVTAVGVNKVYDANTSAVVTLEDDRAAGDVLTASYTAAVFSDSKADVGKTVSVTGVSVAGTDVGNYVLAGTTASTTANITPLTITGHIVAANKVYDGTTSGTISARSLTGVLGADAVALTGGTASFDTKDVGTGKTVSVTGLTLSGTAAANYSTSATVTTTANITPAPTLTNLSGVSASTRDGKYVVSAKVTWQVTSESPAGSVTFTDDGAVLQTLTLDGSGQAILSPIPVPLITGAHAIKASYTPDANLGKNFAASESVMTIAVTAAVSTQPGRIILQPAAVSTTAAVGLVQCQVDSLAPVAPPITLFPACDVDPKSLPSGSSTLTVKVQTVSGASAALSQQQMLYAMWFGAAGIVFLPFSGLSAGTRGRRRKLLVWLGLTLIIGACLSAVACGGGFSNPDGLVPNVGGPGATQPGQYVVVVTAVSTDLRPVVLTTVPVNVRY